MEFRVLGPLELWGSAGRVAIGGAKPRTVLALLLIHANREVGRDQLIDGLWPGRPPPSATATLHSLVYRLRKLLRQDHSAGNIDLRRGPLGYALHAPPEAIDLFRFERLTAEGRRAMDTGDYESAAGQLQAARQLWRGEAFADVDARAVRERAATLGELRLDATEWCLTAELELGRHRAAVCDLQALVADHPYREAFWQLLMTALYGCGRQADALAAYRRLYRLLDEELGVQPSRAVRELHQRILAGAPEADRAFPARTGPRSPVPRLLPACTSDFVGRCEYVQGLDALLPDADAPTPATIAISTLTGMGGIGKTTLAIHWAHRVADRYPDGQLFIDLHGHTPATDPREPGEALDHLLRALGVPGTQIPDGVEDRAALYRSRLAGARMLIVLDNAAAEDQVTPLLPGSPGCLVLITSRSRLAGLDARTLSLEILPTLDAVDLFLRAAGRQRLAGQPPGELVELVELVELCGRLPLAIRLAGARLRSHPAWHLSHLVDRLRAHQHRLAELEAGQRSLTAALDLSYQHLDADQQRTYRLLGLQPGPDIDPYATAALLGSTAPHAAWILDQLLDANLLHEPVVDRYRFHDLTRAHAAHIAQAADAEPVRRSALTRLLTYYRHTAAVAMDTAYPYEHDRRPQVPPADTPTPALPDPAQATAWLDIELPNLLAAARHAADHGPAQHLLHLSCILHPHLRTRGRYADAATLHQHALTTARATNQCASELDALTALGYLHRLQGRPTEAAHHFQHALRLAATIGHRAGELDALTGLGFLHRLQGRYTQAAHHFRHALRLAGTIGHPTSQMNARIGLGEIHWVQGCYAQAACHYRHALRLAGTIGHRVGELQAHNGLGGVHRLQGRYTQAVRHYRHALRLAGTIGDRAGELTARNGLSEVRLLQGRYAQAADHCQRCLDLARETGNRNYQYEALQGLGRVHHATGHPDDALTHHQQALILATDLQQPADQARAHDGLAHTYHTLDQPERARQHWQQALDILTSLGAGHTEEAQVNVPALRAHLANLNRPQPKVRVTVPWHSGQS